MGARATRTVATQRAPTGFELRRIWPSGNYRTSLRTMLSREAIKLLEHLVRRFWWSDSRGLSWLVKLSEKSPRRL